MDFTTLKSHSLESAISHYDNSLRLKGVNQVSGEYVVPIDSRPYPKIKKSGSAVEDISTVALLKEDYAGAVSELTAITLYIFQNMYAGDKAFSNAMRKIAIVEMMHLDMIGDAIVTLGGSPSFDNGKHYWNASYVDYARDLKGMLDAAIEAERSAIKAYKQQVAVVNNSTVRDFLLRIIDDEKLHLDFFERLRASQG